VVVKKITMARGWMMMAVLHCPGVARPFLLVPVSKKVPADGCRCHRELRESVVVPKHQLVCYEELVVFSKEMKDW